jgi:hypothetical protein
MVAVVGAVSAQDTSTDDPTVSEAPPVVSADAIEGLSDADLSSQEDHVDDDEDVFKPTDVVSFAQSVPFPVDI